MAISATHYHLLCELKERGELPQGGRILEIGKANWYGDLHPSAVSPEIPDDADSFAVVQRLYEVLCSPVSVVAIDLDPAAFDAQRRDLNTIEAGSGDNCHSIVINHGTAEHVFNIANVFRVMHDACLPSGLMIHESPFTGWVDHGFYCLQPTLFYDLAAANGYQMVMVALEHLRSRSFVEFKRREDILEMRRCEQLPDDALLFVALRKVTDAPFQIPMQGLYSAAHPVSADVHRSWRELR